MPDRKAVAPTKDFGDATAMADLPIGFVAQQAARRGFSDRGGRAQRQLGLGPSKLFLDNRPKPVPFAPVAARPSGGVPSV